MLRGRSADRGGPQTSPAGSDGCAQRGSSHALQAMDASSGTTLGRAEIQRGLWGSATRPFFSSRCCSDVTWSQRPPVISPWGAAAAPARTPSGPRCLSSLAPVFPPPCPWSVAPGGREVRKPGQRGLEGASGKKAWGLCTHPEGRSSLRNSIPPLLCPPPQRHFLSPLPLLPPYLPSSPFPSLWASLRSGAGETSPWEVMRVQTGKTLKSTKEI